MDPRLIGTWVSDPEDEEGIRELGRVTIEFTNDGELTYTIHAEEKDQKMFLTYIVEEGLLVTNQPSQPREDRTSYSFTSDGRLILAFGGQRSVYVKATEQPPWMRTR